MDRLTAPEQPSPGQWQPATVTSITQETPSVRSYRLRLARWVPHLPGQHYDVRLSDEGFTGQRSYSVASSPLDEGHIELTIDRQSDGDFSPHFHDRVAEGDTVEVQGPFPSEFVWRGTEPAPVLLVGGGSGVVPLMAILRHRRLTRPDVAMRLVYSVRRAQDVIFADELGDDSILTFTREPPAGWTGHTGWIDATLLAEAAPGARTAYVCGSDGFVDTASALLLDAGLDAESIRTERFGTTP